MAITLDGTITGTMAGIAVSTISLVTTQSNDFIVACFGVRDATSQTVATVTSSPALTWTRRTSESRGSTVQVELWYTTWSSHGTLAITGSLTASATVGVLAAGFAGVNSNPIFDPHAGLPAVNTGASTIAAATITTTNASDMLLSVTAAGRASLTYTAPSGWSTAATVSAGATTNGVTLALHYDVVSTAQTATVNPTISTSSPWVIIADAVEAFQSGSGTGAGTQKTSVVASPTHQAVTGEGLEHTSVVVVASGKGVGEGLEHTSVALVASGHGVGSGTEHTSVSLVASGHGAGAGTQHTSITAVASGKGAGSGLEHTSVSLIASGKGVGEGLEHTSVSLVASGKGVGAGTQHTQVHAVASGLGAGEGHQSTSVHAAASGLGLGAGTEKTSVHLVASGPGAGEGRQSTSVLAVANASGAGAGRQSTSISTVVGGTARGSGRQSTSVVVVPHSGTKAAGSGRMGTTVTVFSYGRGMTEAIMAVQETGGVSKYGMQVAPVAWVFSGALYDAVMQVGPDPLGKTIQVPPNVN